MTSGSGAQQHKVKRIDRAPPAIEWWRHRLPAPTDGPIGDIQWAALFQWTIHHFRRAVKLHGVPYETYGQSMFVDAAHLPLLATMSKKAKTPPQKPKPKPRRSNTDGKT